MTGQSKPQGVLQYKHKKTEQILLTSLLDLFLVITLIDKYCQWQSYGIFCMFCFVF